VRFGERHVGPLHYLFLRTMASESSTTDTSTARLGFDFRTVESKTRKFWDAEDIYKRAKAMADPKKKFFFVDGPPYTSGMLFRSTCFSRGRRFLPTKFFPPIFSGKVHLGTAWNKTLKV
jgi:isoleucyl-tRNA synthetase